MKYGYCPYFVTVISIKLLKAFELDHVTSLRFWTNLKKQTITWNHSENPVLVTVDELIFVAKYLIFFLQISLYISKYQCCRDEIDVLIKGRQISPACMVKVFQYKPCDLTLQYHTYTKSHTNTMSLPVLNSLLLVSLHLFVIYKTWSHRKRFRFWNWEEICLPHEPMS